MKILNKQSTLTHAHIDWPLGKEEEQENKNFFKCVSNSCSHDRSELSKYEAKKNQRSTNRYEEKQKPSKPTKPSLILCV